MQRQIENGLSTLKIWLGIKIKTFPLMIVAITSQKSIPKLPA